MAEGARGNCRVLFDARFGLPLGCSGADRPGSAPLSQCERSALLRERIHARRFVDAHGDLRPEHIWLREPVTIIDCLEFDPKLRALDPLDEIAFLHLECERLGGLGPPKGSGGAWHVPWMTIAASGLFLFYRSHRAMLRARLSIAHLLDPNPRTPEKWPRLARVYLKLAAADAGRLERILGERSQGAAARLREQWLVDFRIPADRQAACLRGAGGWPPPATALPARYRACRAPDQPADGMAEQRRWR